MLPQIVTGGMAACPHQFTALGGQKQVEEVKKVEKVEKVEKWKSESDEVDKWKSASR